MVNEEEIGRKLSDQILNNSRSMLSVINRNYVYEKVNLRFCQTLAMDPGSVQGKSLKEIWGAENFEQNIRRRIDRCLEGETVHYQAEFDTPCGNRHYEIIFRPVHSENGDVTHLLAETFDVTREQFLEQRLAQAQRLETVGLLAGGIAHDFNNILTTIYGYAELSLEEAQENRSLNENMARIISAVNRARSLTQQILTFSRQIDQEKVPVNPWLVLNETVTLLRSTIDKNIEIVDNTSDINAMVYADPTQLFRVFMNLLNNALQAMEIKGGTLTVSHETASVMDQVENEIHQAENKFYTVTISDTGTGMEKSVLDRIFEPFFTTRQVGKGTGLGLSVVHGIIRELGGLIDVDSKRGEGTTFRVSIPVLDETLMAAGMYENVRSIICISDNVSESRMLCLGLEMSGYSVSYATSPKSFLDLVMQDDDTPDLVLFMDDLHGFPISELNLIYRESGIKIPLLVISGSQDLILEESFLNSDSARHFLYKPVSLREVRNEIEVAVKKK